MMPSWINKATIYVLGWCLYGTQGFFVPKGTIFSQLLLMVLLLVSLYYVFVANTRYKLPKYFFGLNLLIGLFTVYGIYLIIHHDTMDFILERDSFIYLKTIFKSLLPIYVFYVFFKQRLVNKQVFYLCIVTFFIVTTCQYYQHQREQLIAAMLMGSSAEEFTNNIGYLFLSLIPACVFLYKKPFLQYLAVGYIMVFLFLGMKRGALVIGLFCLIWFLFNNLKNYEWKKKFGIIFLSSLLCVGGFIFAKNQMEESFYFQRRIDSTLEGNSSGRDQLYSYFAYYVWNETSPLQFLFGSGADATLKISYNYAHNDWLEIMVNQGIFGVLIYILYWILFLKECVSKRYPSDVKLSLQLLFIIYFMKTIFSMSYGNVGISAAFILGYCLAQEKNDE